MDKFVNISCTQIDIFKREQFFEIYNDKYLRVIKKNKKETTEFNIALISLSPESQLISNIAWKWLVSATVFLLFSVISAYYSLQQFSLENAIVLLPTGLLFLLLSVGAVYMLIFKSERSQVFYTRYGYFPLIKLMIGKPDKSNYNKFIAEITKKICAEMDGNKISIKSLQAGEMKMLRRLTSQGVLSRNEYDLAKNEIFSYIDSQGLEQVSIVEELME